MNFAVDPEFGWLAGSGSLIHLDKAVMADRGPEVLLEHLKQFRSREYARSEIADFSVAEKREFERAHDLVQVKLKSMTTLELQAMVPVRGKLGSQGDKSDAILVRLPTTPAKLQTALSRAYARCGGST